MPENSIQFALGGDGGKPRVFGLAYGGGRITLGNWQYPIVVDLAGLAIPESVPLLANHENRTSARVGIIRARVEAGCLFIEGEIVSSGGLAEGIVEQGKAGADWQLSIGAETLEAELVKAGVKRTVNGQSQVGPFFHIKRSVLREVSVVAVGADMSTRMHIAASFTLTGGITSPFYGDIAMDFTEWLQANGFDADSLPENALAKLKLAYEAEQNPLPEEKPAPKPPVKASKESGRDDTVESPLPPVNAKLEAENAVKAERDRVAAIQEMCSGEFPRLEQEAIRMGWSVEDASQKVLKAMRESRPRADVRVATAMERGVRDFDSNVIEAALCFRANFTDDEIVKSYGEQTAELAYKKRNLGLRGLVQLCAQMAGHPNDGVFDDETIYAALRAGDIRASGFSGISLPNILSNVANKRMMKSFQGIPLIAPKLCSESEVTDFKERPSLRMTELGDLQPVAPDGEIKHFSLTEESATNQADTQAMLIAITRKMIYNDDLGVFMKLADGIGARAARVLDLVFFNRLLANPNNLFSDGNGNYAEGPDTGMSADAMQRALKMFMLQKDAGGHPVNVAPRFLLVPVSQKHPAMEILGSRTLSATGSDNRRRIPTYNPLADEHIEIVATPYLENPNYRGSSAKAWYLFADPQFVDTFEIVYLQGRRVPTVQTAEADFNKLGMQLRVFWDFGVREQDFRGMLKFKGEA